MLAHVTAGEATLPKWEVKLQPLEGPPFWAVVTAAASRDEQGHILGLRWLIRDVTARKKVEEALLQTNANLEQRVSERTEELAQRAAELRALAAELTISEQRERRRMAELLHDNLQQLLVSAKIRVATLGRKAEPPLTQELMEIENVIYEAINESRSLTAELAPRVLHQGDLKSGLQWLVHWMKEKHRLTVNLSLGENLPPLAEDLNVLLFESVRELLFNAVKHARVGSADVDLRQLEGKGIQITVSDNGPGFDSAKIKAVGEIGGGFGLFSIRERLLLIGGKLEIDSAPGMGSRFILTTPIASRVERRRSPR